VDGVDVAPTAPLSLSFLSLSKITIHLKKKGVHRGILCHLAAK